MELWLLRLVLGTQRGGVGRGQKASVLGVGMGPAILRKLAGPGATGLGPQCGVSSHRATGTTWSGEGRKASRKLGDRGNSPAPPGNRNSIALFSLFSGYPQAPAPWARRVQSACLAKPLSPERSLSRVPVAKVVGCSSASAFPLGAPEGGLLPGPCPSGFPLVSPPPPNSVSSLSPRVWRRQRGSHCD